ncbi:FRG domain-containing protein [Cytobacillus depressus]|uniref:FRG domain-containing protein n=1 Tax=Cytobacillus depressus TaxID=1602942 RepID=A0A6L3V5R4_9BACI|nr:FRG domain-containing protein [Cytobacillus depressus]KAB2336569.1 FRG domain-containing protein [Cytobacillus depressus]
MTIISQHFKTLLSRINQFMIYSQGNIWFRGHSNIGVDGDHVDYKLESTLFRLYNDLEYINRLENNYIYEFMTKGYSIHKSKNEWDLLYTMQHHGVPTRLLDWTTSLSTALYFASREWNPDKNTPCIWLLNPAKLNKALIGDNHLVLPTGDYFKYINKNGLSSRAIAPIYNSKRLIAQQGQFTLQGNILEGLKEELSKTVEYHDDILTKLDLSADIFNDVISYLHMNGVNDFTIFPDLDGLARVIKKRKSIFD